MERFISIAGVCANIGTILTTIMVGILLYKSMTTNSPPISQRVARPSMTQNALIEGTAVSLPGVDWGKNKNTMLFLISKTCRFCSESAPFYKTIIKESRSTKSIKLLAMLPQKIEESKQYLKDVDVEIPEIIQGHPSTIGVRGYPTLMLIDKFGKIKKSWTGKLTSSDEADVLRRINCPNCT